MFKIIIYKVSSFSVYRAFPSCLKVFIQFTSIIHNRLFNVLLNGLGGFRWFCMWIKARKSIRKPCWHLSWSLLSNRITLTGSAVLQCIQLSLSLLHCFLGTLSCLLFALSSILISSKFILSSLRILLGLS